MHDLASQNTERVRELAAMWTKQTDEITALATADLPKESATQKKE
jgi:hypothetical protein